MWPDPEVLYKGVKARVTRGILLDWKGLESKQLSAVLITQKTLLKGQERAQSMKCLPCKHKNPCLISKPYKERKKIQAWWITRL